MKVFVLYLKFVREPMGIYSSNEALKVGMDLLKSKYPNTIKDNSFTVKEYLLDKTDLD